MNRTRTANILVGALILVVTPVLVLAWFWVQAGAPPEMFDERAPDIPSGAAEIVEVPFNGASETVAAYDGTVRVLVEGRANEAGLGARDAFFQYINAEGEQVEEPSPLENRLQLNSTPLDAPPFNGFHIYEFTVEAEGEPLRFSLDSDFTGSLRVHLYTD